MRMSISSKGSLVQKCESGEFDSHTTTMIIINKITGRNISTEYIALMSGLITNDEFELITLTIK